MNSKELDQFYTSPNEALVCYNNVVNNVNINVFDLLLEPSAGTGSFFNILDKDKRIGFDLQPKYKDIIQMNFFDVNTTTFKILDEFNILTIGNPPFGKNSSLAVKFFNHAAIFSSVIAFILPKTFRKDSLVNRLDSNFHLLKEYNIPHNSFIYNDKPYDVPCCFQIWEKRTKKRTKIKKLTYHNDFSITNDIKEATFIIQRVGGGAGTIKTHNFNKWAKSSHLYIKSNIDKGKLLSQFRSINFDKVKFNTAGNPSIAPSEIFKLYSEKYDTK